MEQAGRVRALQETAELGQQARERRVPELTALDGREERREITGIGHLARHEVQLPAQDRCAAGTSGHDLRSGDTTLAERLGESELREWTRRIQEAPTRQPAHQATVGVTPHETAPAALGAEDELVERTPTGMLGGFELELAIRCEACANHGRGGFAAHPENPAPTSLAEIVVGRRRKIGQAPHVHGRDACSRGIRCPRRSPNPCRSRSARAGELPCAFPAAPARHAAGKHARAARARPRRFPTRNWSSRPQGRRDSDWKTARGAAIGFW